ncbi:MAG: branched-chain amino acid ABC transporter permease [Bradyrhizobiaceae bacterium]|nr:MAG: branched-chain amino acid ABC transporter permease [Bradyrhizobiaceae bacterium]
MITQLVASGLALGSIYALLALSLVLIHKATDVVNFAQGEMAMFGTFICFALLTRAGLPLPAVLLLAAPLGVALGVVTERATMRPLQSAPPVNALIATIGLWMIFHHAAGWIWGYDPVRFPSLFSPEPVEIMGARIAQNSLGIIAVSLLVVVLLYLFFEFTRMGVAMRAASMNRRAAQLMGVDVTRTSLVAWGLASAIGVVSGLLIAPLTFLDFEMMFSVLLKAFAGAILGGFNSLPGAVIGCLVIGVLENLIAAYVSTAFKDTFAFGIIILVLMFRPQGLFTRRIAKKV